MKANFKTRIIIREIKWKAAMVISGFCRAANNLCAAGVRLSENIIADNLRESGEDLIEAADEIGDPEISEYIRNIIKRGKEV